MSRPPFNCPSCDRPTLRAVVDSLAAYKCAACGEIVREGGVSA